jgi:YlmC/YmxH family sporulation protein
MTWQTEGIFPMKISELQEKDVVNIADGRKLGQIYDLELDMQKGVIQAIVVPGETRWFGLVSGGHEWVIPWRHIVKIGSDVILVRLDNGRSSPMAPPSHAMLPDGDEYR